jgi:hypothetical protein
MKAFLISFLLVSTVASAQQGPKIDSINTKRLLINKNGMYVLGGWAVVNIAAGTPLAIVTPESPEKYFHEMNAVWNTVNLGLAISGLLSEKKERGKAYTAYETMNESNKAQKILLFNAGLDVAYITTGLFLRQWGYNNPDYENRLVGYGNSLLLQGGFLMAFDFTMFALHSTQNPKIKELFSYVRPTPTGLAFCYNF